MLGGIHIIFAKFCIDENDGLLSIARIFDQKY
jgi:hypothetical protein